MVRQTKRGPKGIPTNLVKLAKEGKRIRFHGFWLGEKEGDRRIAEWLDYMPNAAIAVKLVLLAYIDGGQPPIRVNTEDVDGTLTDEERALLGFDD